VAIEDRKGIEREREREREGERRRHLMALKKLRRLVAAAKAAAARFSSFLFLSSNSPLSTSPHLHPSAINRNKQVRRLKMYSKRAKRDSKGRVVHEDFQSKELPSTRIQPDRRWFGNTRVVGQRQLEQFRDEMASKVDDAYTVLLRQKKLPLSLLQDEDGGGGEGSNSSSKKKKKHAPDGARSGLLTAAPFAATFGSKATRKRPKLSAETYGDMAKSAAAGKAATTTTEAGGAVAPATPGGGRGGGENNEGDDNDDDGQQQQPPPSFALDDSPLLTDRYSLANQRETKDALFDKGQSKRIWGELYKVLDSSDVVVQVLDARDPQGTRCAFLEQHLRRNARHKHLLLLLNKCDLVRWELFWCFLGGREGREGKRK
jgi:nuclear GTP-binding protein